MAEFPFPGGSHVCGVTPRGECRFCSVQCALRPQHDDNTGRVAGLRICLQEVSGFGEAGTPLFFVLPTLAQSTSRTPARTSCVRSYRCEKMPAKLLSGLSHTITKSPCASIATAGSS